MQLIKPKQISGEIMTLFEEAEEKVIVVSPYYKIAKWYKLLNCFEDLRRRNIEVEFYVRENEWESINELHDIGVNPVLIPNLHTKLYMNEKYAIVSSMNMLLSSDTNSLDIALKTKTQEEYQDLLDYYNRYIKGNLIRNSIEINHTRDNWITKLNFSLSKILGGNVNLSFVNNTLIINSRNNYEVFIHNGKTNNLRIFGILSNKDLFYVQSNPDLFKSNRMIIELESGNKKYYNKIWGTVKNFKSTSIQDLSLEEENDIADIISKFILGVEQLKSLVH